MLLQLRLRSSGNTLQQAYKVLLLLVCRLCGVQCYMKSNKTWLLPICFSFSILHYSTYITHILYANQICFTFGLVCSIPILRSLLLRAVCHINISICSLLGFVFVLLRYLSIHFSPVLFMWRLRYNNQHILVCIDHFSICLHIYVPCYNI